MTEHHDPSPASTSGVDTLVPPPPAPAPVPVVPAVAPTHEAIVALQQRIEAFQVTVAGLHGQITQAQRYHRADVAAIGEALA